MQVKIAQAALFAAAGICAPLLTTAPSLAGDGHGADLAVRVEVRHIEAPRQHLHPVIAATGPAIYYSYYPNHIPGLPVPIFPSHRPPVAHQLVVSYDLPTHHVRWCSVRYRSYRAHDNSFQPYHGPRRQCRSPFG